MTKTDRIEKILPQTQCELCDYPGCRPYAAAIADGSAPINKCLPGGVKVLKQLSEITEQALSGTDITYMQQHYKTATVAIIDEERCIGCAKCLKPCPTDAIVGANKFMHSIISDDCTGCEKCVPACPVDCISVHDRPAITEQQSEHWYLLHNQQIKRQEKTNQHRAVGKHKISKNAELSQSDYKQLILDAIARKKNKNNGDTNGDN